MMREGNVPWEEAHICELGKRELEVTFRGERVVYVMDELETVNKFVAQILPFGQAVQGVKRHHF